MFKCSFFKRIIQEKSVFVYRNSLSLKRIVLVVIIIIIIIESLGSQNKFG